MCRKLKAIKYKLEPNLYISYFLANNCLLSGRPRHNMIWLVKCLNLSPTKDVQMCESVHFEVGARDDVQVDGQTSDKVYTDGVGEDGQTSGKVYIDGVGDEDTQVDGLMC